MKKLLTLFFLTLLSVTAVEADNSALKLMGNGIDHPTGNIGGSGGNTWTFTCPGSYFNTWNIVQNNKIYFRPIVDNGGTNQSELYPYEDFTITTSGSSYEFKSDYGDGHGSGSGSVAIELPTDYAKRTFTFYLSGYDTTNKNKITVTVSWTEIPVLLSSTVNGFGGAEPESGVGTSGSPFTWTLSAADLKNAGLTNGSNLYFYLSDADNNYGFDYDEALTNGATKFHVYLSSTANGNNPWLWAWNPSTSENYTGGTWPGSKMQDKDADGNFVISITASVNPYINFNMGSDTGKTGDITNAVREKHNFYLYNGSGSATKQSPTENPALGNTYYPCFGTAKSGTSSKKFHVTYNKGYTYTIRAYKDGSLNLWKINVTREAVPMIPQLKSTIDSWRGTDPESGSGTSADPYVWTWTKQQLSGISAGSEIDFQLYDPEDQTWYGMSSRTSISNDSWSTSNLNGQSGTANWYTTYQKGYTYTISAKYEGDAWQVKITANEIDHDYYWVSPQITNNQKWEYFKMVPSRNRSRDGGDGKVSDKYFSFTIKDSDLKRWSDVGSNNSLTEGEMIQWYIVRDDEARWYRPTSDTRIDVGYDDNGDVINNQTHMQRTLGDFNYSNYYKVGTIDATCTGCFTFPKGGKLSNDQRLCSGLSYTFVLNAKPSGEGNLGNVFINTPKASAPCAADTKYYLIGNFTNATGSVNIDEKDLSHEMTQLWYKSGKEYNKDNVTDAIKASPDSVVYVIKVNRPDNGWGDLYLDIAPSGQHGWSDYGKLGDQYRPLISMGNNLDGRALVGGLTGYNSNQSLNPEPSSFYNAYTLRFNATTMTYNLEFHTSLYLVGDGVTAKDDKNNDLGGTWDLSAANALIPLKATQDPKHFRNTVTFKNGALTGANYDKGFRFLLTEDESENRTYAKNWGEDGNAPKFNSLETDEDHFAGKDTQYKNYLQYNEDKTSSNTNPSSGENDRNIIFDLPDMDGTTPRTYVINFYNYGVNSYYTIEREAELRDFNDVKYNGTTRTIKGRGDYKFFRVWSDYIAWNKPDDVDVFVVTGFNPSGTNYDKDLKTLTATATLTPLTDIKYIPAKTGVILAMKTDKNSLKGGMYYTPAKSGTEYNNAWMQMTPYVDPGAGITLDGGKTSQLLPLYESKEISRYETVNSTEYANYLFGFYRASKVVSNYVSNGGGTEDFLLGFWQVASSGSTYANSAFLQITRDDANKLGVGAYYTESEGGSSAPAFMLLFEDPVDPTVTGIVDVDKDVTSPTYKAVDDNWYTIQGVRIDAPTTKGIYIHGGKKVIVR